MYSSVHHSFESSAANDDLQGSIDGTSLSADACLVLSTDPKPRLRWTAELHERFVDAVTQLGGPESEYSSPLDFLVNSFLNALIGLECSLADRESC